MRPKSEQTDHWTLDYVLFGGELEDQKPVPPSGGNELALTHFLAADNSTALL